jgi:hypothetical protein
MIQLTGFSVWIVVDTNRLLANLSHTLGSEYTGSSSRQSQHTEEENKSAGEEDTHQKAFVRKP